MPRASSEAGLYACKAAARATASSTKKSQYGEIGHEFKKSG